MLHFRLSPLLILLAIVFLGAGCGKPTREELDTKPFEKLTGQELILRFEEADKEKTPAFWNRVLAPKMGVVFSYDPEKYRVGSIGFDINPENKDEVTTESQFLGVMNKETLGVGEEQPYILTLKDFFLLDGSFRHVENSFTSTEWRMENEEKIGDIKGRKYKVSGEIGYHLVFPVAESRAFEIRVFDEDSGEMILKSLVVGKYGSIQSAE